MADKNVGKIIQVISAVLDIKFSEGNLPEINDAVEVPLKNGGKLVVEVAQHLGDDTVRCIAMGPTDGLVRGMDAIATGAPISVPVGRIHLEECSMCSESLSMRLSLHRQRRNGQSTDLRLALRSRLHRRRCLRLE